MIKEIDGKKYIEYNEHKLERNKTIINVVFLILLFLAVVGIFMATITIIKDREMLQSQPIDYVVEKYNFDSCSCVDSDGEVYYSGINALEIKEGAS